MDFLKGLSIAADIVTLAGVVTAIRFALIKKDENILAFRVSMFIHYLFRTAIIILFLTILFYTTDFFYFLFISFLKGNIETRQEIHWDDNYPFKYVIAYFTTYSIGLGIAWAICSFIWTSSWNLTKDFINLFLPKNKILTKQTPTLEITNATYGSDTKQIDVTSILRQMVVNNKLTIKSSNSIAGDPHHGIVKNLIVNYRLGQRTGQVKIMEGETKTIPEE